MRWCKRILSIITVGAVLFGANTISVQASETDVSVHTNETDISYGADIGWLSQLEDQGVTYVDDNGIEADALELLKDKGVNAVRIRAFVNPPSDFQWTKPLNGSTCLLGYCDTAGVLYTAQRAADLGMEVMLVLHYSDHFADPLYQDIPEQWADASATQLSQYVYDYTYYIMSQLAERNIYPKWVEVGNEINAGILLPYGSSDTNFGQMTEYLNSGYNAVKAVSPNTKVVTHLANLGDLDWNVLDLTWFLEQFLNEYNGQTDVIAMSYYPYWIGGNDIEGLTYNMYDIAVRYNKEVMICETGGDENDPEGTYDLLRQEINALQSLPNNKGVGVFYWEPEAHSTSTPDTYLLGATEKVGENTYKFTSALDAFSISPEYLSTENTFEIWNKNSGAALNVSGGSYENAAQIEQYAYDEWDSQKWTFEKIDDTYYKIVNKLSGKVLDIEGMATSSGAECIQYDYNGGWNQMWEIVPTSDNMYMIKNRLSGLYLGISGNSTSNGAPCVQLASSEESTKWYFLVTN